MTIFIHSFTWHRVHLTHWHSCRPRSHRSSVSCARRLCCRQTPGWSCSCSRWASGARTRWTGGISSCFPLLGWSRYSPEARHGCWREICAPRRCWSFLKNQHFYYSFFSFLSARATLTDIVCRATNFKLTFGDKWNAFEGVWNEFVHSTEPVILYCPIRDKPLMKLKLETNLTRLTCHLSHRDPPELVMMGGKLEPQNLSMRGE